MYCLCNVIFFCSCFCAWCLWFMYYFCACNSKTLMSLVMNPSLFSVKHLWFSSWENLWTHTSELNDNGEHQDAPRGSQAFLEEICEPTFHDPNCFLCRQEVSCNCWISFPPVWRGQIYHIIIWLVIWVIGFSFKLRARKLQRMNWSK